VDPLRLSGHQVAQVSYQTLSNVYRAVRVHAGIGDLPQALRGIIAKLDIRTYIYQGAQKAWDAVKASMAGLKLEPAPLVKDPFGDPHTVELRPDGTGGKLYLDDKPLLLWLQGLTQTLPNQQSQVKAALAQKIEQRSAAKLAQLQKSSGKDQKAL
jgi:hypothetical protein